MMVRPSAVYVLIVVPAFNEAANVAELIRRACAAVEELGTHGLIVVDDRSTCESWRVIEAAAEWPEVVGVKLQRSFGQHPAVTAGFAADCGRIIVPLDADLQNPPDEIAKVVARLGHDCDVVSC